MKKENVDGRRRKEKMPIKDVFVEENGCEPRRGQALLESARMCLVFVLSVCLVCLVCAEDV